MKLKQPTTLAIASIAVMVTALEAYLFGCAPRTSDKLSELESAQRQAAVDYYAVRDEAESRFPCLFDAPSPPNYTHRGSEPFTAEELSVLQSVYEKLVLSNLLWHRIGPGSPPPLQIAVRLRVPEAVISPSSEFLRTISTSNIRAVPWQDHCYEIPRCTLTFLSWLSPDSAYVFAELSSQGMIGRGAVAVRDSTEWTICPMEGIVTD